MTLTLLPSPRGGDVATACALKSAVFVLRRSAPPGALLGALLSPGGRGGGEHLLVVQPGGSAALRAGDTLLLARDPWRWAYRLEGPRQQAAPAAPAETQAEADTPRPKRQRKGAAPKRRCREKSQDEAQ